MDTYIYVILNVFSYHLYVAIVVLWPANSQGFMVQSAVVSSLELFPDEHGSVVDPLRTLKNTAVIKVCPKDFPLVVSATAFISLMLKVSSGFGVHLCPFFQESCTPLLLFQTTMILNMASFLQCSGPSVCQHFLSSWSMAFLKPF